MIEMTTKKTRMKFEKKKIKIINNKTNKINKNNQGNSPEFQIKKKSLMNK